MKEKGFPDLEIMLRMQLSQNIHDGHRPGILGSENLRILKWLLSQPALKNIEGIIARKCANTQTQC